MANIEVPWNKLVAAAKELEVIAARHGIKTALAYPVGEHNIVALPVLHNPDQFEFEFKRPGDLPQLDG